jgi:hypothetical protein
MLIHNTNFYDPDIQNIPEYNWQKFQKCLIMEAGIGSDMESILKRIDNVATFADRPEDLRNELNALKLAMFSCMSEISFDTMAMACMVIGERIDTDTAIKEASARLIATGITHTDITDYVETFKKKLIHN